MATKGGIVFLFILNLQSTLLSPDIQNIQNPILKAFYLFWMHLLRGKMRRYLTVCGRKSNRGAISGDGGCSRKSHPVLSKNMSYFQPFDLKRCHVTNNTNTDTHLRSTLLVQFDKLSCGT